MSPTFEFPVPVLSVAADAVRELEGGEALSGLWTLFTKCKASLKDGHRLENISWRLWYREMAGVPTRRDKRWDDHRWFDEKVGEKFSLEGEGQPDRAPKQTVILPTTTTTSDATRIPAAPECPPQPHPPAQSIPTARRNSFVGTMIVDMLPNALPPTQPLRPTPPVDSTSLTSYFSAGSRPPAVVHGTHSLPARSPLPTPAGNEGHADAPSPLIHVQIAEPSTPPPTLPRLVVVNPTPGPTPHPTPPATPIFEGVTLKHDAQHRHPASETLLPMPTSPLIAHADASTSSSLSSGSSVRTAISSVSFSTAVSATVPNVASKPESPAPTTATATMPTTPTTTTAAASVAPVVKTVASPPRVQPTRRTAAASGVSGHLSPDAGGSSHAGPSHARARAQGHIRQTSSASSGGGGGKSTASSGGRRESRSKSTNQSRSRSRGGDSAVGLPGLTMTLAAAGAQTKKVVAAGAGKGGRTLGAMRRTGSGRGGVAGRLGREKRPTFNIGSHSDEGSAVGSKSGGSGSSMSGPGVAPPPAKKNDGVKPPPPPNALPASSTRLLPPAQHHIPDPGTVLPPPQQQQPRRTIVLATTDSDDYETETDTESDSDGGRRAQGGVEEEDEGDTGEWSSESMSADDVDVVVRRGTQQQQTNGTGNGNGTRHAAAAPAATNHTAARRTHSQQHTAAHPHPHQPPPGQQHLSRAQQSRREHAAHAQYVVEQAALETQRIREMFAKKPVPSSEQLVGKRTRSVGLLSQLMNPDPQIFPPTHPYRRGYSSSEIKGVAGLAMSAAHPANGKGVERGAKAQAQGPQRRASAGMAPGLQHSKSSAAIPVASQVQVGSVARVSGTSNGGAGPAGSGGASGGYRPKGRPADQEMEDESDSDGENGRDAILLSKSVAQEKLKALARKRGIVPNGKREPAAREEEEPVPDWARESSESSQRALRHTASAHGSGGATLSRPQHPQQDSPHPTPAPIPVGHPYNLPLPAPPSTPRTTRRLMLQTEMSESLRRNLLWERQVSKVNLVGFRRTASGGGGSGGGGGGGGVTGRGGTVLGGGLRPLTALPSMVQLTAKQPGANNNGRREERERERRGSGGAVETEQEKEERKKRALARNRSWTNDYHYSGW